MFLPLFYNACIFFEGCGRGQEKIQTKTPLRCYAKTIWYHSSAKMLKLSLPRCLWESATHSPVTAPATLLRAGAHVSLHVYTAQLTIELSWWSQLFIKDQGSIVLALTVVESDISNENKTSLLCLGFSGWMARWLFLRKFLTTWRTVVACAEYFWSWF